MRLVVAPPRANSPCEVSSFSSSACCRAVRSTLLSRTACTPFFRAAAGSSRADCAARRCVCGCCCAGRSRTPESTAPDAAPAAAADGMTDEEDVGALCWDAAEMRRRSVATPMPAPATVIQRGSACRRAAGYST